MWTNSVCGHPQEGESFEQAIFRRCRFELGVDVATPALVYPAFRYCETDPSGIMENEVCPVYAARVISDIQPNPEEVMDCQWIALEEMFHALAVTPWAFSPWMVQQASSADARDALQRYIYTA